MICKDEGGYHALYTVCFIIKSVYFCKTRHGSEDANSTLCGKTINRKWHILNNTFDGEITCKRCIKAAAALYVVSEARR